MPATNANLNHDNAMATMQRFECSKRRSSKLAETEDLQCEIRDSLASQVEEIQFGCSLGSTLAKVHAK